MPNTLSRPDLLEKVVRCEGSDRAFIAAGGLERARKLEIEQTKSRVRVTKRNAANAGMAAAGRGFEVVDERPVDFVSSLGSFLSVLLRILAD